MYNVNVVNNLVEAHVFNANQVELMITYSDYNSKFQSYSMNDDGLNGDIQANDGIYSTFLTGPTSSVAKLYIRSQNDDAMMLSPERAEYEFYEYSIVSGFSSPTSAQNRKLLKIVDVLGRETKQSFDIPVFYIYSDGNVEKKIIIRK